MENFINIQELVNEGSVWLAIIAINMTIIGLTSLAETKKIIGVDYGKYLIKSYKIVGYIRIYHLLVIFALINISSIFSMFIKIENVRVINFLVLVLSLVFAIYYFFAYILIENSRVKKQIYLSELSGLYYKSVEETNFEADIIAIIKNGSRTNKRLSSNIIVYFNNFNSDSQIAFSEIFGPDSIIYSKKNHVIRYWKKTYNLQQFDYSSVHGGYHISHEFFQLYRYSELQEKWILEILNLFNNEYSAKNKCSRLDNLLRTIAHINRFGVCENLFKYKFLEYFSEFIYKAIDIGDIDLNEEEVKMRKRKEKFLMEQISIYIITVLNNHDDQIFYKTSIDVYSKLILNSKYNNFLTAKEKIEILALSYKKFDNQIVKKFISEIVYVHINSETTSKFSVESILNILNTENGDEEKLVEIESKLFPSQAQ